MISAGRPCCAALTLRRWLLLLSTAGAAIKRQRLTPPLYRSPPAQVGALRLRCLKATPGPDGTQHVVTTTCVGGPNQVRCLPPPFCSQQQQGRRKRRPCSCAAQVALRLPLGWPRRDARSHCHLWLQAWGLGLDGTVHVSLPKPGGSGSSSKSASPAPMNHFCIHAAANGTLQLHPLGHQNVNKVGQIEPDVCSKFAVVGAESITHPCSQLAPSFSSSSVLMGRALCTPQGRASPGAATRAQATTPARRRACSSSAPPGAAWCRLRRVSSRFYSAAVNLSRLFCAQSDGFASATFPQDIASPAEWAGAVAVAACNAADPLPMLWTPLRHADPLSAQVISPRAVHSGCYHSL